MGGDICVTVGSYGLIILLLTYKSLNALILQLRSDLLHPVSDTTVLSPSTSIPLEVLGLQCPGPAL